MKRFFWVLVALCLSGPQASAQRLEHPSLALGDGLELELQGWVVMNALTFLRDETGYGVSRHMDLNLSQARFSPRFHLGPLVTVRLDFDAASDETVLEEAWFDVQPLEELGVRLGRVRVPFGLGQQTPLRRVQLGYRALICGNPKDYRDAGVLLHGRLWHGLLQYQVGAVTGSRSLAVDVNETPDGGVFLAVSPFVGGDELLAGLELSVFGTYGEGPTRNGFRGRTAGGFTFADPPTIRGVQWRAGAGLRWRTDFLRLTAELQRVVQQRDGVTEFQTVGGSRVQVSDLEDWVLNGWYAEAAWHIFGERSREVPVTGLELAARFEQFDFGDGEQPSSTGEHAPLVDSWVDGVTVGVNAYFFVEVPIQVGLIWQGLSFGSDRLSPEFDPDLERADGGLVHHLFMTAVTEL